MPGNETYDVAIIGGGIAGCIARDAAGRGLSVYLCEQADLASNTSSAATKLIHGGLRYLEHLEFRLVSSRYGSSCRIKRDCGRPGCCGLDSSFMTTSADANFFPQPLPLI